MNSDEKIFVSQAFKQVELIGEEIQGKEFDNCTFDECDFSDTTFKKCKFIDCHFTKCNLSVIKVGYSKFSDIVFEECKIIGVDWTKATWPGFDLSSPFKFYKCILNDSSFFGLNMEALLLDECRAHDVDFRDGDFKFANFTYTDFTESLFHKTNLSGADFSEAINYDIDIYTNDIKGAKFSRFEAVRLLEGLGVELVD